MARVKPSQLAKELKRVGSVATKKEMTEVVQSLALSGFRELVDRSAEDTGFLKNNWDATTGVPPEGKLKGSVNNTYAAAGWPNQKIQAGDKVTLYNNTEYAMYLERGTPRMRAQPMIQPTYHMLLSRAKSAASLLSKKKVK